MGFWALAAGVFAIGFVLPSLPAARKGMWRRLPRLSGPLNHLIRKNLRETLSTLDFWCSAVVSLFCLGSRVAGRLPAEALLPMTIVVMLAFSTYSQTLFGLDGEGGMTRYRLLPVPGWQILAAKDMPFLLVSVLMTLPLAPAAGLAAALCPLWRWAITASVDPPQRPDALAVLQRRFVRDEYSSGRRDDRDRRGG